MVLEELLYDATRRSKLAHARHCRKRHVFRERMSRKKRLQAHESRCGRNVAFRAVWVHQAQKFGPPLATALRLQGQFDTYKE